MKILVITHALFEKPGSIATWARKNGHVIEEASPFKGDKLADYHDFDFLIVMGGPQSALELNDAPYLADEIKLIKKALGEKKRIIGICLGAQLIAEALGARTERSPNREIGAYPIELLKEAENDPVFHQFPKKFNVMHWHNDMPGLPKGAVLLAKSEGCPRQIFRYGDRVYAFQCHFELTKELVEGMIEHCKNDLKSGVYVSTTSELLETHYDEFNAKMDHILNYLAQLPELVFEET